MLDDKYFLKTSNNNIIEKNFSKSSKNYDEFAIIQRKVAKNVSKIIESHLKNGDKILDLGSGSSFLAKNLYKNPKIEILEVDISKNMLELWKSRPKNVKTKVLDIEKLDFEDNSFDMAISSFSLQWLNDFKKLFNNLQQIIKKNGYFIFTIPTFDSLKELKEANLHCGNIFNFNDLPKIDFLESIINKSNFKKIDILEENLVQNFKNGIDAIKSIKKIGANSTNFPKKTITKSKLDEFNKFYLKNYTKNAKNIEVSWIINYFILKN